MGEAGKAIFADRDRDDRVEPQQSEVGQVVSGEPLGAQVGMDQAKASQPAAARAQATPIGQLGARRTADHHVLDIAAAIDQDADLATDFRRQFGHCTSQVIRDEPVLLEAAASEPLEGLCLARLETAGVAVDLDRDGVCSNARRGVQRVRRRG